MAFDIRGRQVQLSWAGFAGRGDHIVTSWPPEVRDGIPTTAMIGGGQFIPDDPDTDWLPPVTGRLFRRGVGMTEPAVALAIFDASEYLRFAPEVPPEIQALWGYPARPAREVGL